MTTSFHLYTNSIFSGRWRMRSNACGISCFLQMHGWRHSTRLGLLQLLWGSAPESNRGFWRSRYLFSHGWVYGQDGAISQRWIQEPACIACNTSRSKCRYRARCYYTDSILVIWRLHSIYIPTLFLSYDDFMPSIHRLYSCHMTTPFHLYIDSIFWAGEGCGATLAA